MRPSAVEPRPAMTITLIDHRHPRCEFTMNPPNMGPKVGPEKVSETVHAIATPLYCGLQQSAITPPKIATGETPNKPAKKRSTKMVAAIVF